jgi:ubiquitin-like modifier-activating enzyme ATG7
MTNEGVDDGGWNVKFVPFSSSVDSPFWVHYCREKLETIKLSEEPIPIQATYSVGGPLSRLDCSESSLQQSSVPNERVLVGGSLLGFNTLDSFQKVDKNELLYGHFCSKFLEGNLAALTSVVLLTFADLKNHKVLYWFGIPALLTSPGKSIRAFDQRSFREEWLTDERQALFQRVHDMRRSLMESNQGLSPYFIFSKSSSTCLPLSRDSYQLFCEEHVSSEEDVVFGFFDPVGPVDVTDQQTMGWPLRNMVAYICFHLDLGGKKVRVLSYRQKHLRRMTPDSVFRTEEFEENADQSILLTIIVPSKEDYEWNDKNSVGTTTGAAKYKAVGWELNARSKPGPRWVNLKPLLDSNHLAIQAADLNLKLMKWRMIPDLNVDLLQSTKVLIIGAGTLGCNVARVLLGWGIRRFKIVDYGKVSYSNPVRQALFTLDDCHHDSGSGRPKAVAAAEALKTIAADVESEGIALSIPMPGHPDNEAAIQESVETLDKLMQECDVAFLLTDTRESRWLPTVMAAAHDKILINAALGLDSWLVIRHGGSCDDKARRFGCYFCNDVVAPENSTRNRTLDQQCTVTRPGLAPIASSMAVEMMVSLLHHPERLAAPAPIAGTGNFSPTVSGPNASECPLGVIPHQIRGSLVSYTMMTPTVPAFRCCTGCSAPVVDAYKTDKIGTVLKTCHAVDSGYLENLSGLTAFRAEAEEMLDGMGNWEEDEE